MAASSEFDRCCINDSGRQDESRGHHQLVAPRVGEHAQGLPDRIVGLDMHQPHQRTADQKHSRRQRSECRCPKGYWPEFTLRPTSFPELNSTNEHS